MRECFNVPGETWLCEAYAASIRKQRGDKAGLPLNEESSRMIYESWDRGKKTELYDVMERMSLKRESNDIDRL